MRKMIVSWLAGLVVASTLSASAMASGPTGLWKQVDENNEVRSLIQIDEASGVFSGKIVKIFPHADEPKNPLCDGCKGAKKDAPLLGLRIIENVRAVGGAYSGGTIIDPEDGSEYKVKMTPSDDGQSLDVRGYIGVEMMGRSQIWLRSK